MSGWAARRFWTAARAEAAEGGHVISLDARRVRTPGKALLVVPTRALAEAIAAEWDAQQGVIDPRTMPVTRSANAAIDKVALQFDEVAEMVAAYGATDHLCYRAEGPEALVARQVKAWDPMLDWAEAALGARLVTTSGIVHRAQPEPALAALSARVRALSPWGLTALHDLTALTGSLVLGLAALAGARPAEEIWSLSRIDEEWQSELWGHDEEAADLAERKHQDFLHAHRFWQLATAKD